MISFTFSCLFHPFDGNVVLFPIFFLFYMLFSIPYLAVSSTFSCMSRNFFLFVSFIAGQLV